MFQYPLTLAPNGSLLLSTDSTRDQILALIDCRFWERCMFTDFGVVDLTFDNTDLDTISLYLARLKVAIDYWIATDCTIENQTTTEDLELGILSLLITVPNSPGPYLFRFEQ